MKHLSPPSHDETKPWHYQTFNWVWSITSHLQRIWLKPYLFFKWWAFERSWNIWCFGLRNIVSFYCFWRRVKRDDKADELNQKAKISQRLGKSSRNVENRLITTKSKHVHPNFIRTQKERKKQHWFNLPCNQSLDKNKRWNWLNYSNFSSSSSDSLILFALCTYLSLIYFVFPCTLVLLNPFATFSLSF